MGIFRPFLQMWPDLKVNGCLWKNWNINCTPESIFTHIHIHKAEKFINIYLCDIFLWWSFGYKWCESFVINNAAKLSIELYTRIIYSY